ncbi:hypothetical protein [Ensifer sp.]|uniref:hypothetical protein n=1 Tax=Ensifer sp. TaxID=1872086 RepID=UPI000DD8E86D|nr:hypothetical protein [Ensifer sp.]
MKHVFSLFPSVSNSPIAGVIATRATDMPTTKAESPQTPISEIAQLSFLHIMKKNENGEVSECI